jgi:16S rRNA (guanine527-N7)-methyltransferase
MENSRIADLLRPFVGAGEISPALLDQLRTYLDLLLKWNARVNLTAVRGPEQIVTRHFGESLFAARSLFGDNSDAIALADVGSGAGFPGIPLKLWAPQIHLTLIESQNKKATFLHEVIRTLQLDRTDVFCNRAEQWGQTADIVTLRAVEKFDSVLPIAAGLVSPEGRLCLLVGEKQIPKAQQLLGDTWHWQVPAAIPQSEDRIVASASQLRNSP